MLEDKILRRSRREMLRGQWLVVSSCIIAPFVVWWPLSNWISTIFITAALHNTHSTPSHQISCCTSFTHSPSPSLSFDTHTTSLPSFLLLSFHRLLCFLRYHDIYEIPRRLTELMVLMFPGRAYKWLPCVWLDRTTDDLHLSWTTFLI